jgi:hypothetical protein
MSPSSDPQREPLRTQSSETQPDQQSAGVDLPPDMLRDVVAETSARLATPQQIDPALQAALHEVARRFPGQPMTLDPAGAAVIEAVLRVQFPLLAMREPLLAKTARTVASSLLGDPTARLRLEHLWATLAEDAA